MGRLKRPLPPTLTREALITCLTGASVAETCQHFQISYRAFREAWGRFGLPGYTSRPVQRAIMQALQTRDGQTVQELRTTMPLLAHCHRQSVWVACQTLMKQGYLRRETTGRRARYYLAGPKEETPHALP